MNFFCLYVDVVLREFIVDPVVRFLQRVFGKNNFYLAHIFIMCVQWILIIYGIVALFSKDLWGFGIVYIVIGIFVTFFTSQFIWQMIVRRTFFPRRRHYLTRERDRGIYFAIRGHGNPAIISLLRSRCRNMIYCLVISIIALFARAIQLEHFQFFEIIALYCWCTLLWLYIRSSQTCIGDARSVSKNKILTLILF